VEGKIPLEENQPGDWRRKFHSRKTTQAIGELYTNKIQMKKKERGWEEIFEVGAVHDQ
jgi:hypothetical protein